MTRTLSGASLVSAKLPRSVTAVLAIATLCSACASSPESGWTPVQAGLYNPAQLFSEETDVYGLRVSMPYTRNADLYGVDVGIASTSESLAGLQANFFYNRAEEANGLQMTTFESAATNATGFQLSSVNSVDESFRGFQFGVFVNRVESVKGMQIAGLHNRAERVVGVQITSLVNEAENLRGVQIGALNFNLGGWLPFFPGFNFGFGGSEDEATEPSESE